MLVEQRADRLQRPGSVLRNNEIEIVGIARADELEHATTIARADHEGRQAFHVAAGTAHDQQEKLAAVAVDAPPAVKPLIALEYRVGRGARGHGVPFVGAERHSRAAFY